MRGEIAHVGTVPRRRTQHKPDPDVLVNTVLSCQSDHLLRVAGNLQRTMQANGLEGTLEIVVKLESRPKGSQRRHTTHRHRTDTEF